MNSAMFFTMNSKIEKLQIAAFLNKKGWALLSLLLFILAIITQANDTCVCIGIKHRPNFNYRKYQNHWKSFGDILNYPPFFFRAEHSVKLRNLEMRQSISYPELNSVNNINN
jgi:hypothetical protein